MNVYQNDILMAFIAFPLIAGAFTAPFLITQYRKYGAVPLLKSIVVYSFILYLMCAYFLVILPLPSFEEAASSTAPVLQLTPFMFVRDFITKSGLVLSDPSTYLEALRSSEFEVIIFNILLFLPLGIYLRYYFKKKWYSVLIIGLVISLFFELTQLSALYGIYPRAYRLCDIDDLLLNTFGALCGFWIAPLFMKFLPSRDRLDEIAYKKGCRVSLTRRFVALLADWFIAGLVFEAINLSGMIPVLRSRRFVLLYIISVIIIFMLIPWLTKGYTAGKAVVKIKLATLEGGRPKLINYFIRYGILYFLIIPAPIYGIYAVWLLNTINSSTAMNILGILIFLGTLFVWLIFIARFFITGNTKENRFLYEKLSGIKNISVIKQSENVTAEEKSANEKL